MTKLLHCGTGVIQSGARSSFLNNGVTAFLGGATDPLRYFKASMTFHAAANVII
jgi:hypothetical protein